MRKPTQRSVTLNLEADIYLALKSISAENRISMTETVSQYIRYLKKKRSKKKGLLNEHTESEFELNRKESE